MKASIVLLLGLVACTPIRPTVSLAPGASLKGYRTVVVAPVTDATRYPFSFSVTDSLRQRIATRLKSHGFTVGETAADTTGPALVITTTLNVFKSGGLALQLPSTQGTSRCQLSGELTDQRTGRRLGEVEASEISGEDTQPMSPFGLLMTCAQMMADAINRQVQKQQ